MTARTKYSNTTPKNVVYATRVPQTSSRSRQREKLAAFWVGLAALIIILPLFLVSGTIIYFQTRQINLPYVFVYDQNVGMRNTEETTLLIDAEWNHSRTILLKSTSMPELQFQFSPHELGIWVDSQSTAQAAFDIGRSSQPFIEVSNALQGQSQIIMPVLFYDENRARQAFQYLADELEIPAVEAAVVYEGGRWTATPGINGRTMNIDPTLEVLSENPFAILVDGDLPLFVETISPNVADLTPLLGEIENMASKELSLGAYDPILDEYFAWSVPLEEKISWVSVEPNTNQITFEIKPHHIERLLTTWSPDLGEGRSFDPDLDVDDIITRWESADTPLVMVHHDPTVHTVRQGENLWSISLRLGFPLWYLIDANPGVNIDTLTVGMQLNIPSKNVLTPLPVVLNKRIVVDISTQRMTVYENGQVIATHIVSTGVEDSPTIAGVFQVQSHSLNAYASNWDLYMPHFIGIYEAWPGFMNGIHGLPTLSSGRRLWAGNLGTPVSFGCIILALDTAEQVYHWADPGVIVEIRR